MFEVGTRFRAHTHKHAITQTLLSSTMPSVALNAPIKPQASLHCAVNASNQPASLSSPSLSFPLGVRFLYGKVAAISAPAEAVKWASLPSW